MLRGEGWGGEGRRGGKMCRGGEKDGEGRGEGRGEGCGGEG